MDKIDILKNKKKIKELELEILRSEIISMDQELFSLEWDRWTWDKLENWLKENRPNNKYEDNPQVKPLNGLGYPSTYCQITENGELQIGPYYHNDNFPRGKDLLVRHDLKKYR